jgi:hypothetical protein
VTPPPAAEILARPFGAASRADLLEQYFSSRQVTAENAWQHVYRLLLWADRTTGLAHCYESDKAQPGRPWYARSLAFHAWLAGELGATPADLGKELDWLFHSATQRLAAAAVAQAKARATAAAVQREPWADQGLPDPGTDPELERILEPVMDPDPAKRPGGEVVRQVTQEIRSYFASENKRKNLLGEGFEDVLAAILLRLPGHPFAAEHIYQRKLLHEIPGFRRPPGQEKARKVDLALARPSRVRVLVSAKWSVRADREEQFGVDFDTYARLEDRGDDFEFVLITNEFDAARLASACDRRVPGRPLFDQVVHVNPAGVLAAYSALGTPAQARSAATRLPELVDSGRLMSLASWLANVAS